MLRRCRPKQDGFSEAGALDARKRWGGLEDTRFYTGYSPFTNTQPPHTTCLPPNPAASPHAPHEHASPCARNAHTLPNASGGTHGGLPQRRVIRQTQCHRTTDNTHGDAPLMTRQAGAVPGMHGVFPRSAWGDPARRQSCKASTARGDREVRKRRLRQPLRTRARAHAQRAATRSPA